MKKKLLELCLSPDLGGLELYMVRASKALNDDFSVISVINSKGKLLSYFTDTVYAFETLPRKNTLQMVGASVKLAGLIEHYGIDIIHLHWTKDIPVAVAARYLSRRKPLLVQTRHMTMTRFKDDFYHRFLYKNIDLILPVTQQVAEQIHRFIPQAIRPMVKVLYMGSQKYERLEADSLTHYRQKLGMDESFAVGMVGRIEKAKGQALLIDAAEKLHQRGVDIHVYFVGHAMQEQYLEEIKAEVEARGMQAQIHFLGFMKNPYHFMQACDAVVLATACETFGLVLVEAMQMGTAVAATKACGPLEIIEDGISGMLFEKDDADSLATCLYKLSSDHGLLEKTAKNGEEKAEREFSGTKQFAKLAAIFKELG